MLMFMLIYLNSLLICFFSNHMYGPYSVSNDYSSKINHVFLLFYFSQPTKQAVMQSL